MSECMFMFTYVFVNVNVYIFVYLILIKHTYMLMLTYFYCITKFLCKTAWQEVEEEGKEEVRHTPLDPRGLLLARHRMNSWEQM